MNENDQQPLNVPSQPQQAVAPPPAVFIPDAHRSSKLAYVLGGMSFIPLIGVPIGLLAIIIGAIKKTKGAIFLGIGGILFSFLLYGGLFYFAVIAKTGPYADLKKQLTVQILNQTKGEILIYKDTNKQLPPTLNDLPKPNSQNSTLNYDAWLHPLIYQVNSDGTFILKSSGPDGIPNNSDDLQPSE